MSSSETKTDESVIDAIVEFDQWCEENTSADVEVFLSAFSYPADVEQEIRDHASRQQFVRRLTDKAVRFVDRSGFRIGNYRLKQSLGRGGQGEVFLATQTKPVHRDVALKLLHLHVLSESTMQRVRKEAQALALLSHPDIASVLDSGETDDGTPYFVMDYAPGIPITAYCDKHALSLENRMRLFGRVCRAIEHAHVKGIVHRDIKPDNLLVWDDDEGVKVKVVDFGFAKLSAELTERFGFNASRTETMMGTPHYASPEQLGATSDQSVASVGPRADIYSLGVVLYELLCGDTPHLLGDGDRSTLEHYRKILVEEFTPAAPSKRVRNSTERHFRIPEELDWIALKAIEYRPDRRFASVRELSDDIERFLNHEPVHARPPSPLYRIRKFVRRQRSFVFATLLFLVAALLGAVATSWHGSSREHEPPRENAVRINVDAGNLRTSVLAVYLSCLTDDSIETSRFDSADVAESALRAKGLVGHLNPETLEYVKDNPVSVMGQLKVGSALCERSIDVPEYLPDYFTNARAVCSLHLEKFDDALDPLIALVGKYKDKPDKTRHEYEMLATFHFNLAEAYRLTHQHGMALTQFRNAMRIDNRVLELPANTTLQVARMLCLASMGNYDEATTVADRVLEQGGIEGEQYQHQVSTLIQVGVALQASGKLREAESTLKIANGLIENDATTRIARLARRHYSNLLLQNARYEEARSVVELWQNAIADASPEEPPTQAEIEMADASLVECYFGIGDHAKSYRLSAKILAERQNRRNRGLSPGVDHLEKYRTWVLNAAARARVSGQFDEPRMNHGVLMTHRMTPIDKRWYLERSWQRCRSFYLEAGSTEGVERCDEIMQRLSWMGATIPNRSGNDSFARIRRELSSGSSLSLGPSVKRRQSSARGDSYRKYENGMIFSHMNDGAHVVTGATYHEWLESGELDSPWGHPVSSTMRTPDGCGSITRFEKAIVFDHPTYGCHAIAGEIMFALDGMSSEHPKFTGFPVADAIKTISEKTEQEFEFGSVASTDRDSTIVSGSQSRAELIGAFEKSHEQTVSQSVFFATCAFLLTSDGNVFVSRCRGTPRTVGWELVENRVDQIKRRYEGLVTGARLELHKQNGEPVIYEPAH